MSPIRAIGKLTKAENGSSKVPAPSSKAIMKSKWQSEVGVVNESLIKQSLNPPYTPPGARMPIMVGSTLFQSPIRTVIRQSLTFIGEEEAEKSSEYRQVIPFVIVMDSTQQYFLLRKINPEADIHPTDHYTLGSFGHIRGGEGIYEALYRIVEEKTGVKSRDINACVFNGYIYNNPVHVGLVFIARVDKPIVKMMDNTYMWVDVQKIEEYVQEGLVDSWSEISYEYIIDPRRRSGTL